MLIGLGYKARSGKDTIGNYLSEQRNFNSTCFAHSLKEAVKTIYGWGDDQVYGHLKEVVDPFWDTTPREVLQKFGTEACRNNLRPDIWVKSVEKRMAGDPLANWVVTDVRFPNEAEFIHSLGGVVVRVDRWEVDKIADGRTQHASELAMDEYTGWDFILDNNGTLNTLFEGVDNLLEHVSALRR